MYKRAFVLAAALCVAATVTVGTVASASGDEGRKVRFVDTSPITTLAEFTAAYAPDLGRCFVAGKFDPPCVVPVTAVFEPSPPGSYNDTLTGDFQGTGRFKGSAVLGAANDLNPATLDFPFESYNPLSLSQVEGCGTGTLILHTEGNLNSTSGVWQIVPGSGRGDLLGISGGGTYSASAPFTPNHYVGHVRCAKHDD